MSNKILNDEKRAELEKERNKKEKERNREQKRAVRFEKIYNIVNGWTFRVICLCVIIFLTSVVLKDFKVQNERLYSGYINWKELKVPAEDLDNTGVEVIDGTIGFDKYIEYRKKEEKKLVNEYKPFMSDSMYHNVLEGIESKYYYDSVQADYIELCKGMKNLIAQSQWIKKLYEAYEKEIGIADHKIDYCMYPENNKRICELKEFIETFTTGELQLFLLEAHSDWEALTNYRKDKVAITDGYMDLLYQESLCTNIKAIDKLDLEVITVGKSLYDKGPAEIAKAHENKKIAEKKLDKYVSERALNQLGLYHDIDFFDAGFDVLVPDTISALFTPDSIDDGSMVYMGKDISEEDLVDKLKSGNIASRSNLDKIEEAKKQKKVSWIDGLSSMQFSLTGRDERDMYYVFFDVKECKHDLSMIKSREDMAGELEDKSKIVEAQKDITAIITAEVNDLDIQSAEDVRAYFPNLAVDEKEEPKEVDMSELGNGEAGQDEAGQAEAGQAEAIEESSEAVEESTDALEESSEAVEESTGALE